MVSSKTLAPFAALTAWPIIFSYTFNADDLIDAFKSGTDFLILQTSGVLNDSRSRLQSQ
jgi:hypothetical protein